MLVTPDPDGMGGSSQHNSCYISFTNILDTGKCDVMVMSIKYGHFMLGEFKNFDWAHDVARRFVDALVEMDVDWLEARHDI
jgi:hypothetical protein